MGPRKVRVRVRVRLGLAGLGPRKVSQVKHVVSLYPYPGH